VAQTPGATALLVGPNALLDKYEAFLRESGEAERLPRLYPRDFWPPEAGDDAVARAPAVAAPAAVTPPSRVP
jgi:hypothetical protein